MNVTQLTEYYSNLLPLEYKTQPKAAATIQALAYMGLLPQDGGVVYDLDGDVVTDVDGAPVTVFDPDNFEILPLAITSAFDIQTAEGQQLQYIAEAIGAKSLGYNLSGQLIQLTDDEYRLLLQAASARNYLRATLKEIDYFINFWFPGILRVKDELGMHMSFVYLAELGALPWVELFITQGFLPRPLTVAMVVVNPFPATTLFGFRTYLAGPAPWVAPVCTYTDPVTTTDPVLTYSDFLEV